jgi:lipoprotein-anchoring transpeptidase ErfK/SrfK
LTLTRGRGALALGIAAALLLGATALRHAGGRAESKRPVESAATLAAETAGLPTPARPAFVPGRPVLLPPSGTLARFAPVLREVEAHRGPTATSAALAALTPDTPEGTTNIVLVLGETTRASRQWVHVRLPVLPNDQTAWVPRGFLGGYGFVHTRLVVDRERFTATLFDDGRAVFRAPVGVGKPESPTPGGRFYIRDKVSGFGNPFYGPIAYGTSARSAVLTDWPGGGFVGIHGTNEPELIPGRISHGCIRMRNPDILRLSRLMPVGTPLTIS